MPLKADNKDLPTGPRGGGNPPDLAPRFGMLLAQAWQELDQAEPHQKSRTDIERYIRLGWAGKCARDIGYRLLGVPPSNPADLAASWRMGLGTMVHEALQASLVKAFPGAEIEKVVDAAHDEVFGFPVSGRSDVFLVSDVYLNNDGTDKRTLIEVKTINGWGFKSSIGARGTAEGPRTGAIFQAALNARAHQADEVVILYLSMECLSDRELAKLGGEPTPERKFLAEWTYQMADLDEMVDRELMRLGKIMEMVDVEGGPLPPRSIPLEMPSRARVTNAKKGTWTETLADGSILSAGETFWCNYCDYQDRCVADGPS